MIAITLVAANVYDKSTTVGNDVMLCTGVYHGYAHFHGTQQGRFFWKTVITKPGNIIQYLIYSIISLASGSMSRFPVAVTSSTINPFLQWQVASLSARLQWQTVWEGVPAIRILFPLCLILPPHTRQDISDCRPEWCGTMSGILAAG